MDEKVERGSHQRRPTEKITESVGVVFANPMHWGWDINRTSSTVFRSPKPVVNLFGPAPDVALLYAIQPVVPDAVMEKDRI